MEKRKIKVGYCRVSTKKDEQEMSLENQINLMKKNGCDYIFHEQASGRNDKRIEFLKCIKKLKELAKDSNNDVYLIVFKNDRWSRKFRTLITTIEDLIELGINYISIVDNINTDSIGGKMYFQMLSSFNEYEVANTRERIILGLEAAKAKGVKLGRPKKLDKSTVNKVIRLYQISNLSVKDIAKRCSISESSCYTILKNSNISRRR